MVVKTKGNRISTILQSLEQDSVDQHMVMDRWTGDTLRFQYSGAIPERFAVHMANVHPGEPPVLTLDQGDRIFQHASDPFAFGDGILDVCAGTGSMGASAEFMGGKVLASVDFNHLAAEHLRRNHHGEVFERDISDLSLLKELHVKLENEKFTLLAGYPCQPYSTQGRQDAEGDPRAATFEHLIFMIFILRPQACILECVAEAAKNQKIQRLLHWLCQEMNWACQDVVLELAHQWIAARKRWWCIISPKGWNRYELRAWEKSPQMRISDVLPRWGEWPCHEEIELQLSAKELSYYLNKTYGKDRRLLETHEVAPTTLHSYSVALEGCPCGCRAQSFSDMSLSQKGLRGFFVHSTYTCQPRFLHPTEHAILLSVPATMDFDSSPRAGNCLLGLVAAPLQCLWAYSHLVLGASKEISTLACIQPARIINDYKTVIKLQAKEVILGEVDIPRQLVIHSEDGKELHLLSPMHATIANLVEAERIALTWGETARISEGCLLLPDEFCISQTTEAQLSLQHRPKRQKLDIPIGTLVIGIVHEEQYLMAFAEAGDFLFMSLRSLGLHHVNWVIDEDGKVFGADLRMWRSQRFFTMTVDSFPSLFHLFKPTMVRAAGQPTATDGLSDKIIYPAMTSMLKGQSGQQTLLPVVLQPWWTRDGLLSDGLRFQFETSWHFSNHQVFIACAHDDHWYLLHGSEQGDGLHWTCFDGLRLDLPPSICQVAAQLTRFLGLSFGSITHQHRIDQPDDLSCGAVAVGHFAHCLGLSGNFNAVQIQLLYSWLRSQDHDELSKARGPGQAVVTNELASLLARKGVPSDKARHRAAEAIKVIGLDSVQTAFRGKNPWQLLKAEASKPNKAFKFVQQEELADYIAQRAEERYGAETRPKKDRSKKLKATQVDHAAAIDPKQVKLVKGHFEDTMKSPMEQLLIEDVTPDASGIAVCTQAQAQPYCQSQQKLSTEALALLIIGEYDLSTLGYSDAVQIQFPAHYAPTEEPVLLHGVLVQLGDTAVQRATIKGPMCDEETLETAIIKVVAHKDELQDEWDALTRAPIRTLIQAIPKLQLCKDDACDQSCYFFHAPVDEDATSVIHEVWARKFQSDSNAVTAPPKADQFQVYLRVSSSALQELIKVNAVGVYVEPRSSTHRGPHEDYSVIWMPNLTRDETLHKLRMTAGGLSIARFRGRYGIRVHTKQEERIHAILKPADDYIKLRVCQTWKLHPLPYGIQKQAVQRLLREWKWSAKALQPLKGSQHGSAWEVGAETPPEENIQQAYGKDVLITLIRQKGAAKDDLNPVIPKKTQMFLRASHTTSSATSSKGSDPWQNWQQDPWAKKSNAAPVTEPIKARIDEVTDQLRNNVKQMVQKEIGDQQPAMSSALPEATERRFQTMECGLKELQQHNRKLTTWIEDAGNRFQNNEQQLQTVATTLASQQQDLAQVRVEVKQSFETTQQSLHGAIGQMKQDLAGELGNAIQGKLDSFATHFESMMAKKMRTD